MKQHRSFFADGKEKRGERRENEHRKGIVTTFLPLKNEQITAFHYNDQDHVVAGQLILSSFSFSLSRTGAYFIT